VVVVKTFTKHRRSDLHRLLDQLLGKPESFSEDDRLRVKRYLSGWLSRQKLGGARNRVGWYLSDPRDHGPPCKDILATEGWADKRLSQAIATFHTNSRIGYWNIRVCCYVPGGHRFVMDAGIKHEDKWDKIGLISRKVLWIVISPNYQRVASAQVQREGWIGPTQGRKIVQTIWDHRDYDDVQAWQCRYWDFTCLSNDEESWKRATHHVGWVAKTGVYVAVEQEFEKAIKVARQRTVQGAIRSIIRDHEAEREP
jgi:hypothetical protein